ncbi:unnamed protein product [Cuscuta epithymum]|nr:unnamed protein product [Cuscuta epithymum]CAH9135523.1 unnamed protein product [Cuscuta epithymum]
MTSSEGQNFGGSSSSGAP